MNYLLYFFWGLAAGIFVFGLFVNYGDKFVPTVVLQLARYGRANKSSKVNTWKSVEVPKSWFGHFYLYAVVLQATLFYSVIKIYTSSNPAQVASDSKIAQILTIVGGPHRPETIDVTTTILASFLFLLHLSRRLYESWFVSIFSGTKMNILHYLIAFLHYTGAELAILAHSVGFADTINPPTAATSPMWKLCYKHLNALHIFAIVLFLYGSYQQNKAHLQYADLRKGSKKEVVNYAHRIPRGGLFEKVSCPNYWAEIVIYTSFCFLFQLTNATWNYVFLWVVANQITSGVMNHKWYKKTFPDYPKERKAIIPHVW